MTAIVLRRAVADDVPTIVAMLADDPLGATRENTSAEALPRYLAAFHAVDADPNKLLAVAALADVVVGCLQVDFLPGLSRQGAWRGQIESVRVAAGHRGQGLGERMIFWAVERCRERGCAMVQLTSDLSRVDAHRFYERLGFHGTHLGMKLTL